MLELNVAIQKKTNDIMQNLQTLNEAKISAEQLLKLFIECGLDGKSVQPAIEVINLKLSKIDERVKRVCASENDLLNYV